MAIEKIYGGKVYELLTLTDNREKAMELARKQRTLGKRVRFERQWGRSNSHYTYRVWISK